MDFTPEMPLTTSRISTLRRTVGREATRSATRNMSDNFFDSYYSYDLTHLETPEESIKRFLEIGDFESAVYWIDSSYAKAVEGDRERDPVKFAKYVKLLTSAQQWLRVSSVLENSDKFYARHILFACFYVKALFHRKLYAQIAGLQIGHLLNIENTPMKTATIINGMDVSLCGYEAQISTESKQQLDEMAEKYFLHSSTLLVLGQTYLYLENREAAAKFLRRAFFEDPYCLKAEHLLVHYKLLETGEEESLRNTIQKREPNACDLDPKIQTKRARGLYARGDPKRAICITNNIFKRYGWYMDCIIVHVNSLVMLEDADALFTFSQNLVDALPEHEFTWYAVSLYYYTCKNTQSAKSFMNKATLMNTNFGDGWLAFGHILAADSDNDQALSCYYRAARIMEKNFEPSLYIAMQYCKSGVKLSKQFLHDGERLAPANPIVFQEQGCHAYNEKDFQRALGLYEKALMLLLVEENLEKLKEFKMEPHEYLKNRVHPIDVFWAPLLNNLGHCCRRLKLYEKAAVYHQVALMLHPTNPQALCSSAIVHFAIGNHGQGVKQINKALSIHPSDQNLISALDIVVTVTGEYYTPAWKKKEEDNKFEEKYSLEKLEETFKCANVVQIRPRDRNYRANRL